MTDKIITQLSIFINNESGSLAAIARTLKDCDINLKAFNIAESAGFGVLRAIVLDPEDAYAKLRAKSIVVKKTGVIATSVIDQPGGLLQVAEVLGAERINVEYGYAYAGKTGPIIFVRVEDPEAAIEALTKAGVKLISEKDI